MTSPIWASIEINKTILGELMSLLYKVPKLYIDVEYENGSIVNKRRSVIIPNIVSGGFSFSWIGMDTLSAFTHKEIKNRIKSITIVGERDTSFLFDSNYKITLSNMSLSEQKIAR